MIAIPQFLKLITNLRLFEAKQIAAEISHIKAENVSVYVYTCPFSNEEMANFSGDLNSFNG